MTPSRSTFNRSYTIYCEFATMLHLRDRLSLSFNIDVSWWLLSFTASLCQRRLSTSTYRLILVSSPLLLFFSLRSSSPLLLFSSAPFPLFSSSLFNILSSYPLILLFSYPLFLLSSYPLTVLSRDPLILLSRFHLIILFVMIYPQVPGGISRGDFRGISGDFRGFPLHKGLPPL